MPLPIALALLLVATSSLPMAAAQTPAPAQREAMVLGATTEQRNAVARTLVPLLRDVRRRGQTVGVQPGTVPNSPFTGTQTTLFAFSIGQKSLPVDTRVVSAMDQLAAWQIDDTSAAAVEAGHLFDQWLSELLAKNASAALITGGGPCDVGCVAARMSTLDESWGPSPRTRGESRDEMLLDALTAAVVK